MEEYIGALFLVGFCITFIVVPIGYLIMTTINERKAHKRKSKRA